MTKQHDEPVSVSIARQPVFDEKGRLWGYELFCLGSTDRGYQGLPEPENAAVSIESSAYVSLQRTLDNHKKIIVDFTEKAILDRLPYALPPALTGIRVAEAVCQQVTVMDMLHRLKAEGYRIVVGGFSADPAADPLYTAADIIAIDTRGKDRDTLAADAAAAKQYRASLLATEVRDRTLYGLCRECGFTLFHGTFFKSPEAVTVRKLTSNEALRLGLLQLIENPEPDLKRLSHAIQADATISFRLLAYLNSAAFAFTQKIGSIRQAITLLGWTKVKTWLRVVLLADVSQSKDAQELVLLSAQRGMFLELVAREHDFWGFDPESLHLLGIFSLLDALLRMPMPEIVAHLPMQNKMKAALCRESNNEYLPLLNLAQSLEEASWPAVETMIQELDLDGQKVMTAFRESVNWVAGLDQGMGDIGGPASYS